MTLATWLPQVLLDEGLHVLTMDGWANRETRSGFAPQGLVCHHTATAKSVSDSSVRRLLRDGRSDLAGPLAQLGLERDGTFVVIAAGRCNHNGYGRWGNDAIGIEAYNDGQGEPWPPAQMDAFRRGAAAICRYMGWSIERVAGHKETDPGRKIDPTFDMVKFRADVEALEPAPPTPQPPNPENIDVDYYYVAATRRAYCVRPWSPNIIALSDEDRFALAKGGAHFITVDTKARWDKISAGSE